MTIQQLVEDCIQKKGYRQSNIYSIPICPINNTTCLYADKTFTIQYKKNTYQACKYVRLPCQPFSHEIDIK